MGNGLFEEGEGGKGKGTHGKCSMPDDAALPQRS
jgi:hypothetical protein